MSGYACLISNEWFSAGLGFLFTLAALLLTLHVAFAIERVKRPVFSAIVEPNKISTWAFNPPRIDTVHLRLLVSNEPVLQTNHIFGRFGITRNTAYHTRAILTFRSLNGSHVFEEPYDAPIFGRWSGLPEPLTRMIIPLGNGKVKDLPLFDPTKMSLSEYQVLTPGEGESELLDIAARRMEEPDAYVWSNNCYAEFARTGDSRDHNRTLRPGAYLVEIKIQSGEAQQVFNFRLITGEDVFKLEPIDE